MKAKTILPSFIAYFLPIAAASTMIIGLVYLTIQQNYRQSANDPQIQIAEDTASSLGNGKSIADFQTSQKTEISQSLAPFIMVFDDSGKVLATTALLHGQTPQVPSGVFSYTQKNGEDRLTWQPSPDTRIASVVTHFSGKQSGFVLAGRNLREVEKRESMLSFHIFSAWVGTMIVIATVCLAVSLL